MTRGERIHALAQAMVVELHHGRWHPKRVETEARDNVTLRRLADVAHPVLGTKCLEWIACQDRKGYGRFALMGRSRLAHRVVFLIQRGRWPFVDALHRCDNPVCVNADHLFEGTNVDNVADRDDKERQSRGEARPNSVLTRSDIKGIRTLRTQGWKQRELSARFGISQPMISYILSGKKWACVDGS